EAAGPCLSRLGASAIRAAVSTLKRRIFMSRVYCGLLSWLAIVCVCAAAQAQVKTVSIAPANAEGEVGQQLKLTVAGLDENGKAVEQKAMAWAAVPSDLAAVSEDGT